jgi:hypothetical protein
MKADISTLHKPDILTLQRHHAKLGTFGAAARLFLEKKVEVWPHSLRKGFLFDTRREVGDWPASWSCYKMSSRPTPENCAFYQFSCARNQL